MTPDTPRHNWRWLRHVAWVLAAKIFLIVAGLVIFFGSGAGNPLLRRLLVRRLESLTGAQVELRALSIRWLSLRATLDGLVIHGREPAGTEPLFAADQVQVGLRIDSFLGRKISLDDLLLLRPRVHVRADKNGSNLPVSRPGLARRPLPETLLSLHVRHLTIQNGSLLYNDVRTPLAIEGSDLAFSLDGSGSPDHPLYLGSLNWQSIHYTASRFVPIPLNLSMKFTVWNQGFTVEQCLLDAAHSHLDAQAEMQDFSQPRWTFRYRGWVNLLDIRQTFRSPETPTGLVDVRGEGSFAAGEFHGTGSYAGRDITLTYLPIFHDSGVTSRGNYRIDNKGLVVSDFLAVAFNGTVKGKVTLRFEGLQFRADTHLDSIRLAGLFPSIEERSFPVDELHWDALLSGDTVETWSGPFRHFKISVKMHWMAPDDPAPGHIPIDGDWQFIYAYDSQTVAIASGEFETPASRGTISGLLAPRNTALDVHFETGSLESYRDFINAIRGERPVSPNAIKLISGNARWDGTITGPSGGPTFTGHVRGERVRYEAFSFDSIDTDITYSPDDLTISRGHARRGSLDTGVEAELDLTDWSFLPENKWSADLNLEGIPIEAIQQLFNKSYPVRGQLTGQFHGRGTRQDPSLTGLFDLAEGNVYGVSFNRLRGQFNLTSQDVRIADAELRVFAPGKENGRGAGIVTGSAGYHFTDGSISADLVGASLPLQDFQALQSARFPVGGQVSFRLKASGAALSPTADGTFRVVDLRVGQTVIGSFDGNLTSDGATARLQLGSAMSTGAISGAYTLGLASPYPLDGKVAIQNIDLDPFLLTALHLGSLDAHAKADGEIGVHGDLKNLDALTVDAKFSRLAFNYANVQLENEGPVHFRSSRSELQIDSARFRGADTNIQIDGNLSFSGARSVAMHLNGALDLRLLGGFVPGLAAAGPAQVNATFAGTFDRPRITGNIHIENGSARVADFPTGLSNIRGDFVFDATRLTFDNLTAQAGGGTLHLAGNLNYADRPLRYDITARSDSTRIRYPEGMSWLTAGTLRLTGTPTAALLSGRVTIERVTLTQGLEVAGVLVSSKDSGISGPTTTSPFLRNLQFDIEAVSSPGARMEWPGAQLEAEANLRVRGTWEHPIFLGHIHVISGDLLFHGNRYRVARGDINFANPFRLDPVINVEATTTIQQYEITLNFNGPASKLTLAYRSDPPLPGNDIVTLLALGQTSSEGTFRGAGTTQTGSASSGASAILSEAVSSQLGGRLEKLFGITRFRVDPGLASIGSTGTEQNPAARVTVEQQVRGDLTITYVSNVSSTQQQVIQVEYNVNRNISIVALRDYNGTFGIDIKIKKRFP